MEACHKRQVSCDIEDACNQHRHKRRVGVSQSSEDTADQIVGDDHDSSAAADPDILHRQVIGRFRGMHDAGKLRRQERQDETQHDSDRQKHHKTASDNPASLLCTLFPDLLPQQNRHAHTQAAENVGDRHHNLGSG